jgi:hypothetical protein
MVFSLSAGYRLQIGRQQSFDFRDARTALRAASQLLFEALQIETLANPGTHRAVADVLAVA